ncbi:MAG TPA: isochorismatase family protein [Phycisphaerales bacterium]|nr:isochorismatase family protein [Phycisphaerales bacterium]
MNTRMLTIVAVGGTLAAAAALAGSNQPAGRAGGAASRAPIQGLSRQPSPAASQVLLDPNDTVVLLLDHQTGLFQTVKDVPVAELRTNTVALANIAKLGKAPIIYTASEPNGPNGPIMDELDAFKDYAQYVARKGEISAWDNAEFVKAVEATGRKTLVMAGVWTSVCVAFPALQAQADGYKVYFVTDASGDPSVMASQTTIARLSAAGITPVSTNVVLCEFQRTWNRPDAAQWGAIYTQLVPHYKAVAESYGRAQEAARAPK